MNPFFRTDLSISDSLKTVRKSVLIYETIIVREEGRAVGLSECKAEDLLLVLGRKGEVSEALR